LTEAGLEVGGFFALPFRGTSLIRNGTPPQNHHKAIGVVLL
jgi:hypothetical protein